MSTGLPPAGGLTGAEFASAFPFHLVLGRDLEIRHCGPSIARLMPGFAPGDRLDQHFRIARPVVAPDFSALIEQRGSVFLLCGKADARLALKGQMLPLSSGTEIAFLASPWITDADALQGLGLSLKDFAVHDPITDYLFLLHTQKMALADVNGLAEDLAAARDAAVANAEALARSQRELKIANEGLEQRVRERVAELVSARHHLEQQNEQLAALAGDLEQARNAAQEADRSKSTFLANMSHELRTPLNAIIGFSEMIAKAMLGPIDSRYKDYADHVHSSGEHLLRLVNDVLDLSKVEAGTLRLHIEPVDIRRIFASCTTLVSRQAAAGEVTVSAEIAPELVEAVGDETRLKQIILNLLSNAVKFTPRGGSVRLTAGISDGMLELAVSDTGIGMTAEDIETALTPFGQVESGLSRQVEGTGLGLPLARRLAELHGGALTVESKSGEGTTVRARLPLGVQAHISAA